MLQWERRGPPRGDPAGGTFEPSPLPSPPKEKKLGLPSLKVEGQGQKLGGPWVKVCGLKFNSLLYLLLGHQGYQADPAFNTTYVRHLQNRTHLLRPLPRLLVRHRRGVKAKNKIINRKHITGKRGKRRGKVRSRVGWPFQRVRRHIRKVTRPHRRVNTSLPPTGRISHDNGNFGMGQRKRLNFSKRGTNTRRNINNF